MLSSMSNPQIKKLIQLQKKAKLREEENVFISEGRKLFEEVRIMKPDTLVKAYVSQSFHAMVMNDAEDYFRGIDYEVVQDSVFQQVAETVTPQGILAIVRKPEYRIEEILKQESAKLLLLEDLRDPGNLGTIMRTAEGAGITGVILSNDSVDMFNPKVIRATMGSIYRVPFAYVEDFHELLKNVKAIGIKIYAAHLKGAVAYTKVSYPKATALLIGNEANGLSKESTDQADQCIIIPMSGQVESLNAAVAAAILMYEIKRQGS